MEMMELIQSILDIIDDQIENEMILAEKNPLFFRDFPKQTRAHIRFFSELAIDSNSGGDAEWK